MWARHAEAALACWLALSPFVFRYAASPRWPWLHDFAVALLVFALACACHARRFRRAHVLTLGVALWLMAHGWWTRFRLGEDAEGALAAPAENHLMVGLLLATFAVVPSRASRPPAAWAPPRESTAAA